MQVQAARAAAHYFDHRPLAEAIDADKPLAFQNLYLDYLQAPPGASFRIQGRGLPVPLHSVAPFVEIPDLLYAPGIVLDANRLEAVNAGARCGVMGQDIMTKGYG